MSNAKPNTNYIDVHFVDPNDLINFIPDENMTASSPTSESSDEDLELNSIQDLKLADKIDPKALEYVIKNEEDVRGRLAIIYTFATFGIFLLAFIVSIVDGISRKTSIIDNLKEILPILSGIFLGTLGFVIGYYFRKSESNRSK